MMKIQKALPVRFRRSSFLLNRMYNKLSQLTLMKPTIGLPLLAELTTFIVIGSAGRPSALAIECMVNLEVDHIAGEKPSDCEDEGISALTKIFPDDTKPITIS